MSLKGRIQFFTILFSIYTILFAGALSAAEFTVNTTDDLGDADETDNVCLTALNNCSLRAAMVPLS